MPDAIATLGLNVDANGAITSTNKLSDSLGRLGGSATKAESSLKSVATRLAGFATAATVFTKFVGETVSAQYAMAQLEAAVKSTGGAAGRTVGQLSAMSAELQKVSTYSDDAVQGAQALLLTFTQIKGDTFDDATRAVVDLSSRMGNDLSGAALQVGKALQDPVTGMNALRKSGVSFSEAQQDVIKSLVETNQLAEAQRMILKELTLEFGGSAKAARDTLGGAIAGLKNAFGDLFEVSRGSSSGVIAALNLLADNLGAVAKAGLLVGAVFGARFLAGAAGRITEMALGLVKARAEAMAYAEAEVRTASANRAASAQRLAALEAEKVELRALAALERERLLVANSRVARAVPVEALAPLGAKVAQRDNAEVVFAMRAQAEAQTTLNAVQSQSIVVNGALAAEKATLAASTTAAAAAEKGLAAATSLSTRAGQAASVVWGMLGGIVGVTLVATLGALTVAMNQHAKAQENAKRRAEDYVNALNQLSPAALQAALATERLGLAVIQQTKVMTGVEYDAKQKAIASAKERIAALEGVARTQKEVATTAQNAAIAQFNKDAVAATDQLAVFAKSGKVAADAFKLANAEWVDATGKNRTLAEALRQSDGAAIALSDAALRAATAQEALGKAGNALKTSVKEQNKAFEEQDDLFRRIAQSTANVLSERLDAMNQTMTAQSAANVAVADSMEKRKADNQLIREQIRALLDSEKAYRAVLLVQAQAAAVASEQAKLPAGTVLSADKIAAIKATVAEGTRLREALDGALDLIGGGSGATVKTNQWADALQSVVGIVQLIASAFGEVGRTVQQIGAGAQSIVSGLKAATSIKDASGGAVGFGKAISGGGGAGAFASALGAGGAVIGGAMAIADAFDLFGKKAKENARIVREAANSLAEAVSSFRRQTNLTSGSLASDISSAIEAMGAQVDNALKVAFGSKAVRAAGTTGYDYVNQATADAAREKAKRYGPTSATGSQYMTFANEIEKLLAAINERVKKLVPKLLSDLDAYYNSAFGNEGQTQLDQAKVQWIAFTQDLVTALNAGGLSFGEYNARLVKLNDAYTENIRKINEEIAAKARQAKEAERRSIFDMNNGALAFTDPRAARDADMIERANRRVTDAMERNASATELASIAAFNAAEALNYLKEVAEADLRVSEGLVGRILATMGDDRATQDFNRAASQRQEMADAIKDGMSETNIALLEFGQFAENSYVAMQRAIEDGTKAINAARDAEVQVSRDIIAAIEADSAKRIAVIDGQIDALKTGAELSARRYSEQIDAIREQAKIATKALDAQIAGTQAALDGAQAQVSALEKVVSTNEKVYEALKEYGDSLKLGALSTLSPEGKLREARAQFEALATATSGGDANAAGNLPSAATALLEASRGFNGSSSGFVADYNRVQGVIESAKAQFGASLPIDQQALLAAQRQVVQLESTVEALNQQKEAINEASQLQIDALESQKAAAAESAKKQIDKLELLKDAIKTNATAAIDRENKRIEDINARADAEIERLKKVEEAAHLERLKGNENWDTFLKFLNVSGGEKATGTVDHVQDKAAPADDPQLSELRTMNETLSNRLERVEELLVRSLRVEVEGSREETGATYAVVAAVNTLIAETRAAAQAAAARTSSVQRR